MVCYEPGHLAFSEMKHEKIVEQKKYQQGNDDDNITDPAGNTCVDLFWIEPFVLDGLDALGGTQTAVGTV